MDEGHFTSGDKKGKSARVDTIPEELVQAGGEAMIDVLKEICIILCYPFSYEMYWIRFGTELSQFPSIFTTYF